MTKRRLRCLNLQTVGRPRRIEGDGSWVKGFRSWDEITGFWDEMQEDLNPEI